MTARGQREAARLTKRDSLHEYKQTHEHQNCQRSENEAYFDLFFWGVCVCQALACLYFTPRGILTFKPYALV